MKNKKIVYIGICFTIILLMISQVTAVSVNQYKVYDKTENNENYDDIFNDDLFNNLNSFDDDWMEIFLDFIIDLLNNEDFLNTLDSIRDNLDSLLSDTFNDIELALEFFNFEEAFNINRIMNDINSIRINKVPEDVQDLLKVEDNTNHFETLYEEKSQQAAELAEKNEIDESRYPIISTISKKIGEFSRLWIDPLLKIFPVLGIYIGCLITCIIFCPILIPFVYYIAWSELAEDYPDLVSQPFKNLGKIIVKLHKEDYIKNARKFVFRVIYVSSIPPGDMVFSEDEPTCRPKHTSLNGYVDEKLSFKIDVSDPDIMKDGGVSAYRDHVQVGFDWNNDFEVDYWTPLTNDYIKETKTITVKKSFGSSGTKKVNVIARDQWGVTSEWSGPITAHIEKSKSVAYKNIFIYKILNNNLIYNIFKQIGYISI